MGEGGREQIKPGKQSTAPTLAMRARSASPPVMTADMSLRMAVEVVRSTGRLPYSLRPATLAPRCGGGGGGRRGARISISGRLEAGGQGRAMRRPHTNCP